MMRRCAWSFLAVLAFAAICSAALQERKLTLLWDYPTDEQTPDMVFYLYHATNISAPAPAWTPYGATTNRSMEIILLPGAHFFYLTASNWWGESAPSNIARTPLPPRSDVPLQIRLR